MPNVSNLVAFSTASISSVLSNLKLDGIDVSYAQGIINWDKLKNDIDFAIVRATAGYPSTTRTAIDAQLYNNVKGASAAGIPIGLYHFCYATSVAGAKREAEHFVSVAKAMEKQYNTKFQYPLYLDFEWEEYINYPKETLIQMCVTFLDVVEEAGYYAGLYSMASWLNNQLQDPRILRYDRWVAHVNVSKPNILGSYGMWQYSWKGKLNGINGDVDLNYGYVDYPKIIKDHGLNGFPLPSTKPEPDPKPNPEVEDIEDIEDLNPGEDTYTITVKASTVDRLNQEFDAFLQLEYLGERLYAIPHILDRLKDLFDSMTIN